MQTKRDELEGIAGAAFDLVVAVEEWLGSAGTREAATDALRRLEIKLIAAGFEAPIGKNLDFRRSILDDLERMGLRYDCRDQELHFFEADEARCYASGPRLADFLAIVRGRLQTGFASDRPGPGFGRSGCVEEGES